MKNNNLEAEYERALAQCRERGLTSERPAPDERRGHVRIQLQADAESTGQGSGTSVIDVSASGIAVHAREPLRQGDHINIAVGGALEAEADVIDCRFAAFNHDAMATHYRINCMFSDQEQGKRILLELAVEGARDVALRAPASP